MTRRTGVAVGLLVLPAAVALTACSSSGGSSGSSSGGTAPASTSATPTARVPTTVDSSSIAARASAPADGATVDAAKLATKMQAGLASVRSAHIALRVDAAGQTVTGSGDEQLSAGKLRAMRLTETVAGSQVGIVVADGKTYAKLPNSPSGKPWTLLSESSSNAQIRQVAQSIDQSLNSASLTSVSAFVHAAGSIKSLGPATVGGQGGLTRYSIIVVPSKLPADTPGKDVLTQAGITSIPVQLWLDRSGRPAQVTENLAVSGQHVSTTVTISRYNQPVTISAPPADQVGTA